MSSKANKRLTARKARHDRVRRKISGTTERPRLAIFRSSKHIYVQAIDDSTGVTVAAASTAEKEIVGKIKGSTGNVGAAEVVGTSIAERLLAKDVKDVVFDRGGFLYRGRVRARLVRYRQRQRQSQSKSWHLLPGYRLGLPGYEPVS